MLYLLDTDTCIGALRGHPEVVKRMSGVSPDDCAVSAVSIFELQTGVGLCSRPVEELARLRKLLDLLREVSFDSPAAKEAADVRANLEKSGKGIGAYDTLIAGHARVLGLTLITGNTREFSRVPRLALACWHHA
jgi:tRNA(fMet)-specific endonuclease VapC